MARGKSVVGSIGRTDTPYSHVEDVPWADLERKINTKLSAKDRHEICQCMVVSALHRNVARDGAPAKKVAELRDKILAHVDGLLSILQTARADGGELRDESTESLLHALNLSARSSPIDIGHELLQLVPIAANIKAALASAEIEPVTSAHEPDVIGLAHFISEAVKGADSTPAKTSPGYLSTPSALEHRRWGLLLSPKNGALPELVTTMLRREVSRGQVQHAFAVAKELGLLP